MLGFLVAFLPQTPVPDAAPNYVVSILDERAGDQVTVRFVLSGAPTSYSATREGDDILVLIAAEPLPGLSMPVSREPVQSLLLGSGPGFTLRVTVGADWNHEIIREMASLRLVLSKPEAATTATSPATAATLVAPPDPADDPSATPPRTPNRGSDPTETNTADLYRRLFPAAADPNAVGSGRTDMGKPENWYSDFTWLGLQARPWVSVSYVDGKTTQIQSNTISADSYWVIQPNLGLGFSPQFTGTREGQWKINYTPRFRRLVDINLPRLTSHFFDVGLDQPVAAFGSVYANYHYSKGVLETDEIDAGREYGIGLNRVVDTGLERFRRNSFGLGVRVDFLTDTQFDLNVNRTGVSYGNEAGDGAPQPGERAFFDYKTRTLNASLRRGFGEGRTIGFLFGVHDTPDQSERKQVEGRGYSYGASLEGAIAPLTTGRILFGYRTQKNPNAGEGGQDYKDIAYGAQLVRELSEDRTIGLTAERKLYLSAYADNGFYVADSIRADLSSRVFLGAFLQGSVSAQSNTYRASPQSNTGSGPAVLRDDGIVFWSLGLARTFTEWAYLRFDYTAERRDSNLDRFDIKTRAFTFQLGLGFFGKANRPSQSSW